MEANVKASNDLETHRDEVWKQITEFYRDGGIYGLVTQLAHGLQCAKQGVIVGGLLHDIGWKLSQKDPTIDKGEGFEGSIINKRAPDKGCVAEQLGILEFCGNEAASDEQLRAQHDVIGATWLRMMGFEDIVAHVTEGHVLAKRYLTFAESDYYEKLSDLSKRTLTFQGGPMTSTEAAIFKSDPHFGTCIEMRRWDEGAKQQVWDVENLMSYEHMVKECIVAPRSKPVPSQMFLREGNVIVGLGEHLTRVNNDDTNTNNNNNNDTNTNTTNNNKNNNSSSSNNNNTHDNGDDVEGRKAKKQRLEHTAWNPTIPTMSALRSPRQTDLLAQWQTEGYVVVRKEEWLTQQQCDDLVTHCESVSSLKQTNAATGPFHTYEVSSVDGSTLPSRTEAFVDSHPALREFMCGDVSPIATVVAHVTGDDVKLYKDKINYKMPGGGGYRPHQDGYQGLGVPQFKSTQDRGFLSYVVMVALDDSDEANGCPQVSPSVWAKKEGLIKDVTDGNDFEAMGPYRSIPLKRGDLLMYDNFMPHRSTKNNSDRARRALFGVYYHRNSTTRDLRTEYYKSEAANRRSQNSQSIGGKANIYHTGTAVKQA